MARSATARSNSGALGVMLEAGTTEGYSHQRRERGRRAGSGQLSSNVKQTELMQ